MIWIILGLVFLVVTYWSLKGTVIEEYAGRNYVGEEHVPLWMLLVAGLIYMIPIFGIIVFIAYNIMFFVHAAWKPKRYCNRLIFKLSDKNILHKILKWFINFLTKDI